MVIEAERLVKKCLPGQSLYGLKTSKKAMLTSPGSRLLARWARTVMNWPHHEYDLPAAPVRARELVQASQTEPRSDSDEVSTPASAVMHGESIMDHLKQNHSRTYRVLIARAGSEKPAGTGHGKPMQAGWCP